MKNPSELPYSERTRYAGAELDQLTTDEKAKALMDGAVLAWEGDLAAKEDEMVAAVSLFIARGGLK